MFHLLCSCDAIIKAEVPLISSFIGVQALQTGCAQYSTQDSESSQVYSTIMAWCFLTPKWCSTTGLSCECAPVRSSRFRLQGRDTLHLILKLRGYIIITAIVPGCWMHQTNVYSVTFKSFKWYELSSLNNHSFSQVQFSDVVWAEHFWHINFCYLVQIFLLDLEMHIVYIDSFVLCMVRQRVFEGHLPMFDTSCHVDHMSQSAGWRKSPCTVQTRCQNQDASCTELVCIMCWHLSVILNVYRFWNITKGQFQVGRGREYFVRSDSSGVAFMVSWWVGDLTQTWQIRIATTMASIFWWCTAWL